MSNSDFARIYLPQPPEKYSQTYERQRNARIEDLIRTRVSSDSFTETIKSSGIYTGSGSPETVLVAPVGSLYLRSNGGAVTTLYVKESGTGNTGWIAK